MNLRRVLAEQFHDLIIRGAHFSVVGGITVAEYVMRHVDRNIGGSGHLASEL